MKPILFSTPMVRAILNTKPDTWPPEPIDPTKPFKWQTRRVIKPQPDITHNLPVWRFRNTKTGKETKCPYGPPGTVLWVRETWGIPIAIAGKVIYKADYPYGNTPLADGEKWRPSIHMPREAARLFLLVKSVAVERIMDITEEDAIKEGCVNESLFNLRDCRLSARHNFHRLWDSLNAKRGYDWESNPQVWVVSFMRIERPVTL